MNNRSLKDKVMSVTLALSSTSKAAQHLKKTPTTQTQPLSHTPEDLILKAYLSRLSQTEMKTGISNTENKMVTFGV